MAVTAAAAIVGAGLGVYKIFKGAADKKKAAREAAKLAAPQYKVQPEYYQNKNIATANAGQGFTSATKDYYTTESQRGLGSSIDAITTSGGSPNDISKLYGVYSRSLQNQAANDAQLQQQNIQRLMEANKDIAGQKNTQWSLNDDRTYQNKLKELKMQQQIADQNMWNGASEAVGSIGALGTAFSNANLIPKNTRPGNNFQQSTAPVSTVSSQQQIQPTLAGRATPNTDTSQPADNSGYGMYDIEQPSWKSLFNNQYN